MGFKIGRSWQGVRVGCRRSDPTCPWVLHAGLVPLDGTQGGARTDRQTDPLVCCSTSYPIWWNILPTWPTGWDSQQAAGCEEKGWVKGRKPFCSGTSLIGGDSPFGHGLFSLALLLSSGWWTRLSDNISRKNLTFSENHFFFFFLKVVIRQLVTLTKMTHQEVVPVVSCEHVAALLVALITCSSTLTSGLCCDRKERKERGSCSHPLIS